MRVQATLALLLAAGCSTYTAVNPPLTHAPNLATGYRWATTTIPRKSNSTLIILAFSGGGTRAAGLSYGVLQQLDATPMPGGGKLIDGVDIISSVSGGSFASMDYALRGPQMLADFPKTFLQVPMQTMLFKSAYLNPKNLVRLLFDPNFHRINVAVELYDDVIFHHATFKELLAAQQASNRPFVIANSTELEIGAQFQWTQDFFDPICSDLQPIRVAAAVAASSNFPVLLPPTILSTYDASACGYKPPSWMPNARSDAYLNPIRARYAAELSSYLAPQRKFLHLLDGGIADNIGLRGPYQALISSDTYVQSQDDGSGQQRTGFTLNPLLNAASGARAIDRVLVVIVNAGTEGTVKIDTRSKEPTLPTILSGISTTPMANYSFDTVQQLLNLLNQRQKNTGARAYPVNIAFSLLPDETESDKELRNTVNNIGTSFSALSDAQLAALQKAANVLIHQDPCFQQFIRDINGTPFPDGAPVCVSALPPTP